MKPTVTRIPKPKDRTYGGIWGKYDWKCAACGKVYPKRFQAMNCCRKVEEA